MHWWVTHLGSMSGSYIAATTAFLEVNIQLRQFNCPNSKKKYLSNRL